MPRPFLEIFPREIRDQIYTNVLASSNGIVDLSPWSVLVARTLLLLRTCKQIHKECKAIIWRHNKLSVRDPTQLSEKLARLSRRIHTTEHVQFCLELLDRDELEWAITAMRPLLRWQRCGQLRSVTLTANREKPRGMYEFQEELSLMKFGDIIDGRLYQESESSSPTGMVVNTGWPRFSHWGKRNWLREMLLDYDQVPELLEEIHRLMGGQMWIDGLLCFENHQRLVDSLRLDPRHVRVNILLEQYKQS